MQLTLFMKNTFCHCQDQLFVGIWPGRIGLVELATLTVSSKMKRRKYDKFNCENTQLPFLRSLYDWKSTSMLSGDDSLVHHTIIIETIII